MPTRKDQLLALLLAQFQAEKLPALWAKLDATQQMAVAEACHHTHGVHLPDRFYARHGADPAFFITQGKSSFSYHHKEITALHLFFQTDGKEYVLPSDIRAQLAGFVPVPPENTLRTLEGEPPSLFKSEDDEEVKVRLCYTEQEAQSNLILMLRSIEQGKLSASAKTGMPSASSQNTISTLLVEGDFYQDSEPQSKDSTPIGPIKAVAWPLLLQAGGLAQVNGSKLALTPAGIKALAAPPEKTLRKLWQKWVKSTLLDEFSRVDVIKGQKSSGRVMTALPPRREAVEEGLCACPPNTWLTLDELLRYMQAEEIDLDICHDPWRLYICEKEYGSLGYGGTPLFYLLTTPYAQCLLLEYCATLGMIDVGLIHPREAEQHFGGHWGTDDLEFLSRYDGLLYLRLNSLGAYCLGLSEQYEKQKTRPRVKIAVQANLSFSIQEGQLSAAETLMLENWAVAESEQSWRLDKAKTLASFERGQQQQEILDFLQETDPQELPQQISHFFNQCQRQAQALKLSTTCLLLECTNSEIAAQIADHPQTRSLCMRAGENYLVVKQSQETKFRQAVRLAGFGIAQI